MRKLSSGQKKILDNYIKYEDKFTIPDEILDQLDKLNSYENMWSDAERYIQDKIINRKYSK